MATSLSSGQRNFFRAYKKRRIMQVINMIRRFKWVAVSGDRASYFSAAESIPGLMNPTKLSARCSGPPNFTGSPLSKITCSLTTTA